VKHLFIGGTADGARYDVPDNARNIRIPVAGIYRMLPDGSDVSPETPMQFHVYERMRLMNGQGTEFIVYLCNNV
jgi:hypothetical protein